MTREEEIQRDLGVKLSIAIEELFTREIAIANRVLPTSAVVILMINTAKGINASAVSAALQARKPGLDPSIAFDTFASSIASSLFAHKSSVLDGLALIEAGREDEAIRRYGAGRGR